MNASRRNRRRAATPAASARSITAIRPRCSTARRISPPTCSMWSAGSTAISPRSTRSNGWRRAKTCAGHDRVQRRLPLVRRRAGLVRGDRARRRAPPRAARQCRDRDRARRRYRRRLRLRLSGRASTRTSVRRSNEILRELRAASPAAARASGSRALPMHLVARRRRACASASCMATPPRSPAGASRTMRSTTRGTRPGLTMSRRGSRIDVFASTHTCLAALARLRAARRPAHRHQQRRRRHAEFRRHPRFGVDHAHRHHAARRTARSTACSATACISTPSRSHYDQRRVSRSLPGALAGRLAARMPSYYRPHRSPGRTIAIAAARSRARMPRSPSSCRCSTRPPASTRRSQALAPFRAARRRGDRGRWRQPRRARSSWPVRSPTA